MAVTSIRYIDKCNRNGRTPMMTIYNYAIIALGILVVLGFISIGLNYWSKLLFGVSLTNPVLCPYCGQCEGEKSDDKLVGRFQRRERRYHLRYGWERPPGNIIWYEKYKIHYQCKHCGREWDSFAIMKQ